MQAHLQRTTELYEECHRVILQLEQNKVEFNKIIDDLTPLVEQLQGARSSFASILTPSSQNRDIKFTVISLVKKGRQLCPNYPAFLNLDDSLLRS